MFVVLDDVDGDLADLVYRDLGERVFAVTVEGN